MNEISCHPVFDCFNGGPEDSSPSQRLRQTFLVGVGIQHALFSYLSYLS